MRIKVPFFCALFLVLFLSCATSPGHYDDVDRFTSEGNYAGALQYVTDEKATSYQEKDRVLYYLDAGLLAHYAGELVRSQEELGNAELSIEECFTKSISQAVSSYVVNDNSIEYAGEDYEDIYINVFNALNYCQQDNIEGALVEVRKVDTKLKMLSLKYDAVFSDSEASLGKQSHKGQYRRQPINFSNSALAHYISMILYRAERHPDDVRIDRRAITKAFTDQPLLYPFTEPSTLDDELSVPKGKARLNVICFSGLAPIKEEYVERVDDYYLDFHMKLAVPVLVARKSYINSIELEMDDGTVYPVEPIEDMEASAIEAFKVKSDIIYNKAIIRSLTKGVATSAANAIAQQSDDGLGLFVSIGTRIFTEVSEQADTRCSRYFPGKASVAGVTLDPGTYSFSVKYYAKNGNLLRTDRFENIEVKANTLNLQESVCLY